MNQVTFLGDVSLLTPSIKSHYYLHGDYVFNLEYVISNKVCQPKTNKVNLHGSQVDFSSIFGKPPLAVCLANNHIMDYGIRGYEDTITFLEKENIQYFGAGTTDENHNNSTIIRVNGTKLALIAYSFFAEKDGEYGVAVFDKDKALKDIEYVKSQEVDTIVVNVHWGEEESPLHNFRQREVGRFLVDQGVDLVIGHHPHCIQPFETYKGKYIFYSLGNCIFPDFCVPSFYDEKSVPRRIYRKRQLKHNKISHAVRFDINSRLVVGVDTLCFEKSTLRKIGTVDLSTEPIAMPKAIGQLIKKRRKYLSFVWSNAFVEGRLFDLGALKHEIEMKRG